MTRQYPHHLRKQAVTRLAATVGLLLFSHCAQSENLVDSALRSFLGNDSNTMGFDLDKLRPQPVALELKTIILASLPKEGRIQKLQDPLQRKLDSLEAVLRLQQRQSVYEVRVFKTEPQAFAFVGLHERAVLLISDAALALLNVEELQASVAHEIAHEYVWMEYREATKRRDNRRLKELELFCDGVAILTLRRAGLGAASLLTAIEKIAMFNRLTTGPAGNAERYPSAYERRRFAQAVVTWADSHFELECCLSTR
jgi:hypothetical protein